MWCVVTAGTNNSECRNAQCVSGLRLLTRQAAFVLSDVIAMARRVVTAGTNNSECRNAHPQDESFFLLGPENDGMMSSIDT